MAIFLPSLAAKTFCLKCIAIHAPGSAFFDQQLGGKKISFLDIIESERTLSFGQQRKFIHCSYRKCSSKLYATSQISTEEAEQSLATIAEVEDLKMASYLFRTETGGLVKVYVRKKNATYSVYIEVSSLQLHDKGRRPALCWGMYRENALNIGSINFQGSAADVSAGMNLSSLLEISTGTYATVLEFDEEQIPFYVSFLLKQPYETESTSTEIRSHQKRNFCVPVGFLSGSLTPLGLSFSSDGTMNFSIFSRNMEGVVLCLYDDFTAVKPALELDLDPYVNKSGDLWHVSLENVMKFVSYGYRFKGTSFQRDTDNNNYEEHVILDPYSKIIMNANCSEQGLPPKYLGQLCKEPTFDWDDDVHPNLFMEKLVVYRLNVRQFTKHKTSQLPVDLAGTFSGVTEKLSHFRDLGVNAVLLEPVFTFNAKIGPYFPCHLFSPMNRYGPNNDSISAINSMKEMVKKFHENGVEVLMEVVFTQTAKIGAMQGIDDSCYYYNSGIGDSEQIDLNCNYPIMQQLILDCLRHWVIEFHIDGFCFMDASSLLRGLHGESLSRPPLVEAIAFDPVLSKTKLIADFWNPKGMVTKETRFPHWKRWAEINTRFCNDVRNYLRGESLLSNLATRLCGSGDLFAHGRGPAFSFNFIARNFGLPLVDLVSFSSYELSEELSWNCGEEGPTKNTTVLERRLKQIRNFLFILFVSLGVPVLNMGDECGMSSSGSPAYNGKKIFNWTTLETGFGKQVTKFISFLSSLRERRHDLLQRRNFLKEENIDWFGSDQSPPIWDDPSCKFLAMTLKADKVESQPNSKPSVPLSDLFIAFSAAEHTEVVVLPPPPEGMSWYRLVDTALLFPGFFSASGDLVSEQVEGLTTYEMKSYSCTMFEAKQSL